MAVGEGKFKIDGLRAGTYTLRVDARDHVAAVQHVTLPAEQPVEVELDRLSEAVALRAGPVWRIEREESRGRSGELEPAPATANPFMKCARAPAHGKDIQRPATETICLIGRVGDPGRVHTTRGEAVDDDLELISGKITIQAMLT